MGRIRQKNSSSMRSHTGAPLRIYIAGPYSARTKTERLHNVRRAIDAALKIFKKGHFPYVPHLTHYIDLRAKDIGVRLVWKDYIRWDMPWLRASDALLFLGKSPGANLEMKAAKKMGKRIFHSVEQIPKAKHKFTHRIVRSRKPESLRKRQREDAAMVPLSLDYIVKL